MARTLSWGRSLFILDNPPVLEYSNKWRNVLVVSLRSPFVKPPVSDHTGGFSFDGVYDLCGVPKYHLFIASPQNSGG